MKPMSAKELAAALQELLRGVQRQIDREGDLELVEGEGEIRGDSGDTNLWIKDGDSYISFSFEGSEIDGELQGMLVPERVLREGALLAMAETAVLSDEGFDRFSFGALRRMVRETGGEVARRLAYFMAHLDQQMIQFGFPPMGSLPEVELDPKIREAIDRAVKVALAKAWASPADGQIVCRAEQ